MMMLMTIMTMIYRMQHMCGWSLYYRACSDLV
jgi:hypothetical protein